VAGTFASAKMNRAIGWAIGYPAGSTQGDALPVLLVLHGRGGNHREVLGSHALGSFLSAAVRSGTPPYAVVAVDGGDHSYWHQRASGVDPPAMIADELFPVLAGRGLRTDRFAVGGWSMGGYGALLLAERLGPSRIAAVAVDSPALWTRAGDSAAGAFDGRADFLAHDVLADHQHLAGIPVRVACGTSDPFVPGVRALLRSRPQTEHDLSPGGHNLAFWQHAAPRQLAFVGTHLT
jgi:S-formylglutathione hydrolase FrmB